MLGDDVQETRDAVKHIIAPPDIVVLDQHLDYLQDVGSAYLGTEIARELRDKGYRGCVCLCTASAPEMLDKPLPAGVDFVFDKGGAPKLADDLVRAYSQWCEDRRDGMVGTTESRPAL